eukprot:gene5338-biopygen10227
MCFDVFGWCLEVVGCVWQVFVGVEMYLACAVGPDFTRGEGTLLYVPGQGTSRRLPSSARRTMCACSAPSRGSSGLGMICERHSKKDRQLPKEATTQNKEMTVWGFASFAIMTESLNSLKLLGEKAGKCCRGGRRCRGAPLQGGAAAGGRRCQHNSVEGARTRWARHAAHFVRPAVDSDGPGTRNSARTIRMEIPSGGSPRTAGCGLPGVAGESQLPAGERVQFQRPAAPNELSRCSNPASATNVGAPFLEPSGGVRTRRAALGTDRTGGGPPVGCPAHPKSLPKRVQPSTALRLEIPTGCPMNQSQSNDTPGARARIPRGWAGLGQDLGRTCAGLVQGLGKCVELA